MKYAHSQLAIPSLKLHTQNGKYQMVLIICRVSKRIALYLCLFPRSLAFFLYFFVSLSLILFITLYMSVFMMKGDIFLSLSLSLKYWKCWWLSAHGIFARDFLEYYWIYVCIVIKRICRQTYRQTTSTFEEVND